MAIMIRTLGCCTRDTKFSIDFDEQERITTYDGLECCILNSHFYDNEIATSSSSSNNAFGSFSSHWTRRKSGGRGSYGGNFSSSPQHSKVKEQPDFTPRFSDVETMKEKFAKLLLGEDVTGGSKGVSTALALSNAITNLGASVFGELWKLEPLTVERKRKWRMEMDWLLSPTNHMIELVPAKQSGSNGQRMEIMTPKARADIHMNLPALQKLDSMLLEMLDSMANREFWYTEVSSLTEGRSTSEGQNTRWHLPSPKVPISGLSGAERNKLLNQGKLVNQILKAAKAINENVLAEMPVPTVIRDALPKSGKATLGEDLHKILTEESTSPEDMFNLLNLRSEYNALEVVNRLEGAILAWKDRITDRASGKSPVRRSWSFIKDPIYELDKMEALLSQAEALLQNLKIKYPNLPQTFLNVTKIQYGTDIGQLILEAYSRVLLNLAHNILTRIDEILQEDISSYLNSPEAASYIPSSERMPRLSDSLEHSRVRQSSELYAMKSLSI